MIESDAKPTTLSKSQSSPQYFFTEEEEIVIRPSTELIPDEYLHENDVALHIFHFDEQIHADMANQLENTLTGIGLVGSVKHSFREKEKFDKDIKNLKKDLVDKKALILIVIGYYKEKDNNDSLLVVTKEGDDDYPFKNVWSLFSANNCVELKNLPKVMLFLTFPRPQKVLVDAVLLSTSAQDRFYDFPAESDMLVILNRADGNLQFIFYFFSKYVADIYKETIFLSEFCRNIERFSKKHDLIDLFTNISCHDHKSFPIIISTLTRKFYLTPSSHREHFLSLIENQTELNSSIGDVIENVKKLNVIDSKDVKSVDKVGTSKGVKNRTVRRVPSKSLKEKTVKILPKTAVLTKKKTEDTVKTPIKRTTSKTDAISSTRTRTRGISGSGSDKPRFRNY